MTPLRFTLPSQKSWSRCGEPTRRNIRKTRGAGHCRQFFQRSHSSRSRCATGMATRLLVPLDQLCRTPLDEPVECRRPTLASGGRSLSDGQRRNLVRVAIRLFSLDRRRGCFGWSICDGPISCIASACRCYRALVCHATTPKLLNASAFDDGGARRGRICGRHPIGASFSPWQNFRKPRASGMEWSPRLTLCRHLRRRPYSFAC